MSIRLSSGNVEQAAGNTSVGFGKIWAGDTGVKMVFEAKRLNAISQSEGGQRTEEDPGLSPGGSAEEKESAKEFVKK